jgi:hypothetical protein
MDFDEGAVTVAQLAEGIEGLDDASALGPATAGAAGQGNDGHRSVGQGIQAQFAIAVRDAGRGVEDVVTAYIFDLAVDRQAILSQADATAA